MPMTITPLTPHVGAEITGVDLRHASAQEQATVLDALVTHGVVVLPDQELPPDALVAAARRFGPVEYKVREDYQLPENRDVYVISNIVENGRPLGNPNDGFAWHTDLSFLEQPTAYTLLYAIETPPEGAETQFGSAFRAYEELPEDRRAALDTLQVRHSYAILHATRKWAAPLSAAEQQKFPDVVHPMVRTHPATGRRAVYLGPHTSQPIGLEPEAGAALIDELLTRATRLENVYSHRWRNRDLVIWDNRGLVHRAIEYDRTRHRRLLHRVTVRGERPF